MLATTFITTAACFHNGVTDAISHSGRDLHTFQKLDLVLDGLGAGRWPKRQAGAAFSRPACVSASCSDRLPLSLVALRKEHAQLSVTPPASTRPQRFPPPSNRPLPLPQPLSLAARVSSLSLQAADRDHGPAPRLLRQLRELLRANPLNAQDANALRSRLMTTASRIADANPAFAASKELEQVLWKPCFYKRIEDFRRRIRKVASALAYYNAAPSSY
ncbi:hypothetical protein BBJ28_00018508 [Nothophytophthora sp. Chile5]|nr:hypothetical protein BBJ28_00018508 [Nothophytophthora sp. Chile5]